MAQRAAGLIRTHPGFRLLWTADAVSQLGTRIDLVALPLLALLTLHASTLQVSLLRTAATTAVVLIGLPAGAWCDRLRSRPVLIATDLGRCALYAAIPLAALTGVLALWQVYLVVSAAGALTVFSDVSKRSWLPRLIGRDHLVEGNTRHPQRPPAGQRPRRGPGRPAVRPRHRLDSRRRNARRRPLPRPLPPRPPPPPATLISPPVGNSPPLCTTPPPPPHPPPS